VRNALFYNKRLDHVAPNRLPVNAVTFCVEGEGVSVECVEVCSLFVGMIVIVAMARPAQRNGYVYGSARTPEWAGKMMRLSAKVSALETRSNPDFIENGRVTSLGRFAEHATVLARSTPRPLRVPHRLSRGIRCRIAPRLGCLLPHRSKPQTTQ